MSEKQAVQTFPTIVVNRNNIDKTMSVSSFGKKSPHYGKQFPHPSIDEKSWDNDVLWFGKDTLVSLIGTAARRLGQTIYLANVDEQTGEFDIEGYREDMADLAVSRETLSDIDEQMDELQAKQEAYVNDPNFGATIYENGVDTEVNTPECIKLMKVVKEINAQLKPLREKKAEIEAKYQVRAEKRKITKAAKKAAAEAAKAQTEAQTAVTA